MVMGRRCASAVAASVTVADKGLDPRYCNAVKRDGSGKRCRQPAGHGVPGVKTGCCSKHGGATRTHKAAAEREQARQACELFGLEMEHRDPGEVLLDEILRARRAVAWHETEIALAMRDDDQGTIGKRFEGWQWWTKHLTDVSAKALQLGLQRRVVEAMEGEARRFVAALHAFVDTYGLDRKDPKVIAAGHAAIAVVRASEGEHSQLVAGGREG